MRKAETSYALRSCQRVFRRGSPAVTESRIVGITTPTMALDTSNAPADEFDDLFNYSVDMQDVFLDANVTMDAPVDEQPAPTKSRDENLGLGIDEEVKVTKRRASVPKLDENRLGLLLGPLQRPQKTHMFSDCFLRPVYQSSGGLLRNASDSKAKATKSITLPLSSGKPS